MAIYGHQNGSNHVQTMPLANIVGELRKLGPATTTENDAVDKENEKKLLSLAETIQSYPCHAVAQAFNRWPSADKTSWPSTEDITMFMDNIIGVPSAGAKDDDGRPLVREHQRNEFATLAVKVYQRVTMLVYGELKLDEHQRLFGAALKIGNGERLSFGVEGRDYWTVEELMERLANQEFFDGYVATGVYQA